MFRRLVVGIGIMVVLLSGVGISTAQAAPLIDPTKTVAQNLETIYPIAVRIIALLAFLAVIYAGYLYIASFGVQARLDEAKAWLGAAITGVVLIILLPVIVRTIDMLNERLPGQ